MRGARRPLALATLLGALATGLVVHGAFRARAEEDVSPPAGGANAWVGETPDVSLVLWGNQRGHFLPVAGRDDRVGGLERAAVALEGLRLRAAAGRGFAGVSVGWTLGGTEEPQEELQADLYRALLERLGFAAHLLGTPDLLVPAMVQPRGSGGGDEVLGVPRPPANLPPAEEGRLALAAADPIAAVEVGGLSVRALGVVDEEQGALLVQSGLVEQALGPGGALQLLTPRPDALWLVATDASRDEVEEVRRAVARLGPCVIVDLRGDTGTPRLEGAALEEGPHVVALADRGRQVGVLDLVSGHEGWRLSYHAIDLLPAFDAKRSEVRGEVRSLLAHYRDGVRRRGYLEGFTTLPGDEGVRYVGPSACARCHPDVYADWLATAHADAFRTLEAEEAQWDPRCVRCHAVGFQRYPDGSWARVEGGFVSPARTPHLGGVGCESCHGPGSRHVEDPDDVAAWAPGGPNRRDPGPSGCRACHDAANSPDFPARYERAYRPRVDHREVPRDRRTRTPP